MSAAWMWTTLAASLVIAPRPPVRTVRDANDGRRRHGHPGSPARRELLPLVATLAAGSLCVATLGLTLGGIAALVVSPLVWALVGRVERQALRCSLDLALPLTLDLAAAAIRSGQPVAAALELAAPAAGPDVRARFIQVAGLLRLGADPLDAWQSVGADPALAPLAQVARRSAASGIRLASAWEQAALDLRAEARSAAVAKAHRAGVLSLAPLGLCFLPAFVCIGVIPDVLGLAGSVFRALP